MAGLCQKVGAVVSIEHLVREQKLPIYVSHPSYSGVAFEVCYWKIDWDVPFDEVGCVMVGDDEVRMFPINEINALDDDRFCHSCGQIGCSHGAVE